ncbi:sulfite exporter TauE/SafE family protein [Candidatus Uhrbacteria bacterium]|nr:sulfite exporter TauE/SafE family protein [Candidatus Uhrbacteria bacterium]
MAQKYDFELRGTTCQSCEVVIERDLSTLGGVQHVSASHNTGRLTIETFEVANEEKLLRRINERLGPHGYQASEEYSRQKIQAPWNLSRIGGALVLILAVYVIFKWMGLSTFSPQAESAGGLFAIFAIGLVASVSSCTAVVIGLLAAVSSAKAKEQAHVSSKDRLRPHFLFNIGRIVGFAVFGALIGLIGSAFQLSTTLNGLFVIVIALVMMSLGLHLLDVVPSHFARLAPPKWLSHRIHALQDSKHPAVPFVLGALTFFLPCGFTQSMQLYALSLGNPLQAALVMAVFALGTAPALLSVGILTSVAKGKTLQRVMRVAGAVVVVLGLTNMQNGAALFGMNFSPKHTSAASPSATLLQGGQQYIQMEVTSRSTYEPDTLEVIEGVPVEWQVYGSKSMGCASTLVQRDFGVQTRLQPGINTIRFTPNKVGNFLFSCSMGMVRGTLIVKPRG